jgi:hypothetical protein
MSKLASEGTLAQKIVARFLSVVGTQTRPIHEIAREILQDWKPVYFGAKPYLEAMLELDKVSDSYGEDPGSMILAYFLSNARGWKGEKAKAIKTELKKMIGTRSAHDVEAWGRRSPVLPREHQVPADAGKPLEPEGTDLAIYTWDDARPGRPKFRGMAFAGKGNKALWDIAFTTQSNRIEEIRKTIERRKEFLASKQRERDEKANFQHGLKVGDILYCSWGYDQTNIDFYQITEERGKMVVIREIAAKVVEGSGGPSERVVPEPNQFVGDPMLKRPTGSGSHIGVKVHSFAHAHPWDGKPLHRTGSGYGH